MAEKGIRNITLIGVGWSAMDNEASHTLVSLSYFVGKVVVAKKLLFDWIYLNFVKISI